jgi:hypothetical protein
MQRKRVFKRTHQDTVDKWCVLNGKVRAENKMNLTMERGMLRPKETPECNGRANSYGLLGGAKVFDRVGEEFVEPSTVFHLPLLEFRAALMLPLFLFDASLGKFCLALVSLLPHFQHHWKDDSKDPASDSNEWCPCKKVALPSVSTVVLDA